MRAPSHTSKSAKKISLPKRSRPNHFYWFPYYSVDTPLSLLQIYRTVLHNPASSSATAFGCILTNTHNASFSTTPLLPTPQQQHLAPRLLLNSAHKNVSNPHLLHFNPVPSPPSPNLSSSPSHQTPPPQSNHTPLVPPSSPPPPPFALLHPPPPHAFRSSLRRKLHSSRLSPRRSPHHRVQTSHLCTPHSPPPRSSATRLSTRRRPPR